MIAVDPPRSLETKLRRFALTGVANTVIDMSAFAVLVFAGLHPLGANVLAWACAVCFSYAVNARWSFVRNEALPWHVSFLRFVTLGALISLAVSTLSVAALTELIGLWPAKVIGVVIAAALNFLAARWSIEGSPR